MPGKRRVLPLLLIAVAVGGMAGAVALLFQLRFNAGDVYPPYSTLRSDPLGARVLYEGLARLENVEARRNLEPQAKALEKTPPNATFVLAGVAPGQLRDLDPAVVDPWVRGGGRLVATLTPDPDADGFDPGPSTITLRSLDDGTSFTVETQKTSDLSRYGAGSTLADLWEFGYAPVSGEPKDLNLAKALDAALEDGLPGVTSWRGDARFRNVGRAWRRLYEVDGKLVLMERSLGRGSVVLAADSYFLSNQALRTNRSSRLLAWMLGPNRTIVFDETHHGVARRYGVAVLAREYGLLPALGVLTLAGLLFAWRGAAPLAPRIASRRGPAVAEGRDAASGFLNLLRRNLSREKALEAGFQEWRPVAPAPGGRKARRGEVDAMQGVLIEQRTLPPKERDPEAAYRAMAHVLTRNTVRKKTQHTHSTKE